MNSSLRGKGEFTSRSSGRAKIVWCTRRVENAWLQKKEKFFNFDTSASGGFSRKPCGIPAVYNSGVRAERRVDIFCLVWWKREVLPTSPTRSPAGTVGGQREDFFMEKESSCGRKL